MPLLEITGLKKTYTTRLGGTRVEALKNVSFTAEQGEYIAIMGESGSGKTTLLNILAALDKPTGGSVILDGMNLAKIRDGRLADFRRDNLGFVFQEFNLLDTFTVRDNILLPLVLRGEKYSQMEPQLNRTAQMLGISSLLDKYPYEISGGQKQRTAAASRRANRSVGQQEFRRTARAVRRNKPQRSDDNHGDALCQGGEPGTARAFHQGRHGIPSTVPRRRR